MLEKYYIFDGITGDHPVRTEQTKISWKKGKNVTKKIHKKVLFILLIIHQKQRNKKTGQSRTVEKEIAAASFFQFFNDKMELQSDNDEDEEV